MFAKFPFFWSTVLRVVAFTAGMFNPYLDLKWKVIVFILVCVVDILEPDSEGRPKWLNVSVAFILGLLVSYIIYPFIEK
ncbi:hypothetical protein OIN60_14150 [Paenibacillus sp. P96]|uniref:Uncharacterized protein n=1 Tax=Paenibacillus zeirhizosphaerae TaxID=2987519 RepID=A0ABT9FTB3_9BACL|nr:hypothetical protein [Paenibacillus sp. P96]MDP4097914.1 hypothetical protein [Paenibacillus sp. P96]